MVFFLFCLQITQCYFEGGFQETPVYILTDLKAGHVIRGPAIIMNDTRYFSITHKVFPYYTQDISVLHTRYFSITHNVFQYCTQFSRIIHCKWIYGLMFVIFLFLSLSQLLYWSFDWLSVGYLKSSSKYFI